jgi:hypothetical protein
VSYLRLLRQRPVLILWLAETLSVFGDRFFTLALMWTVWDRAGAVAMGVVVMIESIPHILIGAFGRRVLSRFASFRALAVVDAAQVAVVGAMPWLWDSIGLPGVMAVIVLIGTADAITEPNRAALTPELVEKDQVQPVNGLMDLTGRFTWVLGPGTAAVLLAFISAETLFLIDAVTFAASALALGWLARHASPRSEAAVVATEREVTPEAPRAWPLLCQFPGLGSGIALHGVGEFLYTITSVGVPVLLTTRLDVGADAYAMVVTCMGIGSVVGNLVAGNAQLPGRFLTVYCGAWVLRGVVLAWFAFAGSLEQVLLLTLAASLTIPLGAINLTTELSRLPLAERLRLMTVDSTGMHIAGMGGMAVLPALVAAAPGTSFFVSGVVVVVAALVAWAGGTALSRRSTVTATEAMPDVEQAAEAVRR